MESTKLLTERLQNTTTTASTGRRHKANGPATAALLIQIASEMLSTSPTLRKRMGVTLTDLAAADKVRRGLTAKSTTIQ